MNHVSTGHKEVAMTGLQAQFFRGLGRGVCEGCGHLRRQSDLQCTRCRVVSSQQLLRAGVTGMRAMSRTCWKTLPEPGKVFVETCEAGMAVGRQRRRACPALSNDFVGRCEALGSATLVHVPNPAREELCAIVCDGLEEKLDGDDN